MKNRIRNDIILALALLLAALAVWGVVSLTRKTGEYAVVLINGEETARYPLDKDAVVEIETEDGHVNTLVIKDGEASVTFADCPDKLCVKQRAIKRTGETIICLPHKLVIRIEGGGGVDTVV
ncbi:MAG: NusG domain II-containing protein [Clostridiales bacterium]|nr:NusG domain II-containing protein [Clostridiales bacterium]